MMKLHTPIKTPVVMAIIPLRVFHQAPWKTHTFYITCNAKHFTNIFSFIGQYPRPVYAKKHYRQNVLSVEYGQSYDYVFIKSRPVVCIVVTINFVGCNRLRVCGLTLLYVVMTMLLTNENSG